MSLLYRGDFAVRPRNSASRIPAKYNFLQVHRDLGLRYEVEMFFDARKQGFYGERLYLSVMQMRAPETFADWEIFSGDRFLEAEQLWERTWNYTTSC
jgi:hypothetical protein